MAIVLSKNNDDVSNLQFGLAKQDLGAESWCIVTSFPFDKMILPLHWGIILAKGQLATIHYRDVSTRATGATDTITLLQSGGQIMPTIAEVAPKFFLWLRPCSEKKNDRRLLFSYTFWKIFQKIIKNFLVSKKNIV